MQNFVRLRKSGSRWEFESETELEDFVWANLQQLLSLIPLKRQYRVNGQICDIVAVDENKQLVVIELKNGEDRYIVQQLTRYYDALLEEKAFNEEIDYGQPVRLVAIAPNFHKDNLTDRKYHQLSFLFLQFEVIQNIKNFYFQLKDIDREKISEVSIPQLATNSTEDIPIPPPALQKLLNECTPEQIKVILYIRNQILSFDKRLEEMSTSASIKYGNGKSKQSKLCAEFCADSKGAILIFLWLPRKGLTSKIVGRARIWTDWNGEALVEGYVSEGIGTKINSHKRLIANRHKKLLELSERKQLYINDKFLRQTSKDSNRIRSKLISLEPVTYEEIKYIEEERNIFKLNIEINDILPYKPLELLVELALKNWLKRL